MTTETTDGIRALYTEATDESDKAILGALLTVAEAEANGHSTDETQRCEKCALPWPTGRLDGEGICPHCLLDELYLRQRNWRRAHYLQD